MDALCLQSLTFINNLLEIVVVCVASFMASLCNCLYGVDIDSVFACSKRVFIYHIYTSTSITFDACTF